MTPEQSDKLWKLIQTWAENQESRATSKNAQSDYNKIEEYVEELIKGGGIETASSLKRESKGQFNEGDQG